MCVCGNLLPPTEGERVTSRRRSRRRLNTLQVKQLQDGEEIYNALMNAPDPTAFQVTVTIITRVKLTNNLLPSSFLILRPYPPPLLLPYPPSLLLPYPPSLLLPYPLSLHTGATDTHPVYITGELSTQRAVPATG